MNCSQSRALFSSYIDAELSVKETFSLERHLDVCVECENRWAAMQRTVELVRDLPHANPDPAFVGHVLDRVRAFEAGEYQPIPLAEDELGLAARNRHGDHSSIGRAIHAWVSWAGSSVSEVARGAAAALRRPVPVLAGGALVAGAAVMAVVFQSASNPLDTPSSSDRATAVAAATPTAPGPQAPGNGALASVARNASGGRTDGSSQPGIEPLLQSPFEGLAAELDSQTTRGRGIEPADRSPVRVYAPDVWAQSGVQQVSASYERPRITF